MSVPVLSFVGFLGLGGGIGFVAGGTIAVAPSSVPCCDSCDSLLLKYVIILWL